MSSCYEYCNSSVLNYESKYLQGSEAVGVLKRFMNEMLLF